MVQQVVKYRQHIYNTTFVSLAYAAFFGVMRIVYTTSFSIFSIMECENMWAFNLATSGSNTAKKRHLKRISCFILKDVSRAPHFNKNHPNFDVDIGGKP